MPKSRRKPIPNRDETSKLGRAMGIGRRGVLGGAALASLALGGPARAQQVCEVVNKAEQAKISPAQAIDMLMEGNRRFLAGQSINCDLLAQVRETSQGQAPFAAVVGCIDSRVPPEIVFDRHIGDIFAARIAGNFVNDDIIGSLEFATQLAGAKAIMVLGHSECGAIKGAIDRAKLGKLTTMLQNFEPAIAAVNPTAGERSSKNHEVVQAVADANAKLAAKSLIERSDVLRALVEERKLIVTAAMHDISTGKITLLN